MTLSLITAAIDELVTSTAQDDMMKVYTDSNQLPEELQNACDQRTQTQNQNKPCKVTTKMMYAVVFDL